MPRRPGRLYRSEVTKRLKRAFGVGDIIGGLITPVINAERRYRAQIPARWGGYLRLMDSFQALYLETLLRAEAALRDRSVPSGAIHYRHLVLAHVGLFRRFRATENLFQIGYSFSGFALLRDVYDQGIHLGALAAGLTDMDRLHGGPWTDFSDEDRAKRSILQNRKREEARLVAIMCGRRSGLSPDDRKILQKLNDLFNDEVHGGQLSSVEGVAWLRGQAPLPVPSDPDSRYVALYFNRALEAAWLITRALCFLQPNPRGFGHDWARKWAVMDRCLREFMFSVDDMGNKPFAKTITRWVDMKFPFSPKATSYRQPIP